ncbi:hypothetical protein ACMU_10010 [Actibacterium mucosum KCTC 23349]|uniref:Molybdate ABC transporter substrate-binding protein n=1 Tax=Actibacterium mucosum KCTC 23349 TaxID=1454373 RepID=A0A037ZIZ5_9RHOB|nr:molybdate ABC transporter substrate-binding protein [Actibacterium mucosum]KAJ56083.1 hypothetical protein ACMU_10010 [Actibacterium mucosum KCTC 23349]
MIRAVLFCVAMAVPCVARALDVAVATNFAGPLTQIAAAFTDATGEDVVITAGSTGKLYAQIRAGAPFDVFLSADRERPALLHEQGRGGEPVTYATGRLVLWAGKDNLPGEGLTDALTDSGVRHVAVANPGLAPYGAAAVEVLQALDVFDTLEARLVYGQNVGQAHALAASGNAQLALIAASVAPDTGRVWTVPTNLHAPIRQDAILLRDDLQAKAFLTFLQSPRARDIIAAHGMIAGASE